MAVCRLTKKYDPNRVLSLQLNVIKLQVSFASDN